jgi:MFS family permease
MGATCGDLLGAQLAPAALGFITVFFGIGQAVGPSAAGYLADALGTFTLAFWLAAGMALLGAGGAALLKPVTIYE